MGLKTLTETLMGGEVDEYSTNLYSKVDNCEMFGYCMAGGRWSGSSGFGSAIGGFGSGFSLGSRGNIRRDLGFGLQERYDFSGHNGSLPHLNHDILGSSFKLSHIDLGFKKKW